MLIVSIMGHYAYAVLCYANANVARMFELYVYFKYAVSYMLNCYAMLMLC